MASLVNVDRRLLLQGLASHGQAFCEWCKQTPHEIVDSSTCSVLQYSTQRRYSCKAVLSATWKPSVSVHECHSKALPVQICTQWLKRGPELRPVHSSLFSSDLWQASCFVRVWTLVISSYKSIWPSDASHATQEDTINLLLPDIDISVACMTQASKVLNLKYKTVPSEAELGPNIAAHMQWKVQCACTWWCQSQILNSKRSVNKSYCDVVHNICLTKLLLSPSRMHWRGWANCLLFHLSLIQKHIWSLLYIYCRSMSVQLFDATAFRSMPRPEVP